MLYQVEARSLLKPRGYKKLADYLSQNAKLASAAQKEIVAFSVPRGDLRLVKSDQELKLVYCLSGGRQSVCPEMAVVAETGSLAELTDIFLSLKFKVAYQYQLREKNFQWLGMTVSLINVRGLGLVVIMKKLVDSRETKKYEQELRLRLEKLLTDLALPLTPAAVVKAAYLDYKKHWAKLIKKDYIRI